MEYDVERILGSRMRFNKREFLIRWLGYDENEDSWEPEENLGDCIEIVQDYLNNIGRFNNQSQERKSVTPMRSVAPRVGTPIPNNHVPVVRRSSVEVQVGNGFHKEENTLKEVEEIKEEIIVHKETLMDEKVDEYFEQKVNAQKKNSMSYEFYCWETFKEVLPMFVFLFGSIGLVLLLAYVFPERLA